MNLYFLNKFNVIFGLLLLFGQSSKIQAQNAGYLNALNAAGTTGTSGTTTYNYSVGEAVIFNNSCSYTPGVIQPTCVCIVPIAEVFDEKYKANFFPNPTSSQIFLETDYAGFSTFRITTLDGKTVSTDKFVYQPVDISSLPSGTYFLQVSSVDNQVFKTFKIIKQ